MGARREMLTSDVWQNERRRVQSYCFRMLQSSRDMHVRESQFAVHTCVCMSPVVRVRDFLLICGSSSRRRDACSDSCRSYLNCRCLHSLSPPPHPERSDLFPSWLLVKRLILHASRGVSEGGRDTPLGACSRSRSISMAKGFPGDVDRRERKSKMLAIDE